MKKKVGKVFAGVIGLVLFASIMADNAMAAQWYQYPGLSCQKALLGPVQYSGTDASVISDPTNGSVVSCPITGTWIGSGSLVLGWRIDVIDNSAGGYVDCNVNARNYAGSTWSANRLYSCSTAGGCTSPSASFTGTTYLLFSNPFSAATNINAMWSNCTMDAITNGHRVLTQSIQY